MATEELKLHLGLHGVALLAHHLAHQLVVTEVVTDHLLVADQAQLDQHLLNNFHCQMAFPASKTHPAN